MANVIKIVDMIQLAESHPVYRALQEHFANKEKVFFEECEKKSRELNAEINTMRSGLTTNLSAESVDAQAKRLGQRKMMLEREFSVQQQKMHIIEQVVTGITYDMIKNDLRTIMSAHESAVVIDVNACPFFTEAEDITSTVAEFLKNTKFDIENILQDAESKINKAMGKNE